jgi:hypothetical protein
MSTVGEGSAFRQSHAIETVDLFIFAPGAARPRLLAPVIPQPRSVKID